MNECKPKSITVTRYLVAVPCLIAFFLLPLWGRCLYESSSALVEGRTLRDQGDIPGAIVAFGRALRWQAPLNSYAESARAEFIALEQEQQGDALISLLREYRRALFLSRSWHLPAAEGEKEIDRLNLKLVELGDQVPPVAGERTSFSPSYGTFFSVQFFFWGWVLAVLFALSSAFLPAGGVSSGRLVWSGSLSLIFFLLWLAALGMS